MPSVLKSFKSVKRKVKRKLRSTKKSFRNAFRSFRPDEITYRLAISRFKNFEVAYRQGTADESVIVENLENDEFFSTTRYQPAADHVIIDVGSHIGTFSLLAAVQVPQGAVYAIEASLETFNYLRINILLNRLDNIKAHHIALSDQSGPVILHYDEGNWGHSIMKRLTAHGESVNAETLPEFLAKNNINKCDFIKFNCEGAEFPILLSTPPEVLATIDRMLILYHCDLASDYNLDALLQHLHSSHFKTEIHKQEAQRGWIVAECAA